MGGNALKNTNIVRISLLTLNKIKEKIKEKISDYLEIDFMIENPEKKDFGDLDVIYKIKPGSKIVVRELIETIFCPVEIFVSGDIISFAYPSELEGEYVQIDFIKCKNLKMSKFYFSFGDLGNILGYITNYYNIKFGHFGLFVKISKEMCEDETDLQSSNFIDQFYLTDEPEKICEFFQLDYSSWSKLSTEHEIFSWVCSSPYFSKQIYKEVNNKTKRNIYRRPMYIRFVEWLNNLDDNYIEIEKYDRRMEAIKYFDLEWKLKDIFTLNKIIQERKNKFNGNKIIELKILQSNKELGKFITKFKSYITDTNGNFEEWLDGSSSEEVDIKINSFAPVYNTSAT